MSLLREQGSGPIVVAIAPHLTRVDLQTHVLYVRVANTQRARDNKV